MNFELLKLKDPIILNTQCYDSTLASNNLMKNLDFCKFSIRISFNAMHCKYMSYLVLIAIPSLLLICLENQIAKKTDDGLECGVISYNLITVDLYFVVFVEIRKSGGHK